MNVNSLSSSASLVAGGNQLNAVSGASSYVPATASTTDPLISQMRSSLKQNSEDFKALKSALKSNDLTGATQAYSSLQQDIQNASQAAGGKSPFDANSPLGKDFQALGDALKSGDITATKQAFAAFKHDMRSAGSAAAAQHRQHAAKAAKDGDADDGGQSSAATTTNPATTSPTSGSTLNTTA